MEPRFAFRSLLVVTSLAVLPLSAAAAPKPLIGYFKPMPIRGKLSTSVWGASTVGARDPANGLEDNGASGGVAAQKETYFYWDGKILKGEDGKFHLFASRWSYGNGFGPPGGGASGTGWEKSIPIQAISDDVMGPYVTQGNCYAKNLSGNELGHNTTALITPSGSSPYTLSVGEIVPGQMFSSSSASGPWALLGSTQTNSNGHGSCGSLGSNFTFTVGPDQRFWATSRGGCVMDSDHVQGPYQVETNSILPNLENNDNGNAEDEVIWYSGGYFHIVWNYWNVQRGYHIMSKNGVSNWMSTGLAYQGTQSPTDANSKWLRYTDGTVNTWHNMERVGVYQEGGHVTHFTFAVTDVDKNGSGVNQGGSKILVVPFDGVQFDCDNGDAASCAEIAAGGAGGAGAGGASNGGSAGTAGASSAGTAGAVSGAGGDTTVAGSGGSSGELATTAGTDSGGISGLGGANTGTAGASAGLAGASYAAGTGGAPAAQPGASAPSSDATGCSCRLNRSPSQPSPLWSLALGAAALAAFRRNARRRKERGAIAGQHRTSQRAAAALSAPP